MKKKEKNTC